MNNMLLNLIHIYLALLRKERLTLAHMQSTNLETSLESLCFQKAAWLLCRSYKSLQHLYMSDKSTDALKHRHGFLKRCVNKENSKNIT